MKVMLLGLEVTLTPENPVLHLLHNSLKYFMKSRNLQTTHLESLTSDDAVFDMKLGTLGSSSKNFATLDKVRLAATILMINLPSVPSVLR